VADKELYKKICSQYSDIPLFLQDWWLDAVCNEWDVAIAKSGEQIAGIWPYQIEQKMGVNILRTPKLTPYQGPFIFYPADVKESNKDGFEHEIVTELLRQIPKYKVWNLALQPGFKQAGILKSKGLQTQVQQTFLIDLARDEQTIFSNLKENLRRNIRAGEKGITITNDPECVELLFQFQKQTLTNKGAGQAYTLQDMQRVMDACYKHEKGALWVAKAEEKILAAVWNVWDKNCGYYLMGAQNPEIENNNKAMSVLLWHSIKQARERGNTTFDLEGSMDQGVERFFRNFGGKRELYMVLLKNDSLLWQLKEKIKK